MRLDKVKIVMIAKQKGLNQGEVVKRSSLSRCTVSAIYNGKSCNAETAGKIAAALGVRVEDLAVREGV